ncbi:serine hydrolase domain-containing protein [Bacillus aquiflavi]|nr:serine hydrolase [Bacillus aquiflavi]
MKTKFYQIISLTIIFIFIMSFMGTSVYAKDTDNEVEKLEKIIDQFMKNGLKKNHVAGATLVVVKDGHVLLKKGYGYSDVEKKVPVDPDETLFRIGSITKLFTATAAMQFAEKGEIDLHTDINQYLKEIKIENDDETPLTMASLLTNTGGFADSNDGVYSEKLLDELVPLSNTIKNKMPSLIRAPDELIQYSNHGFSLIGYIVEQVSGIPFNQYIEENIFKPLQMNNSYYFLSPQNLYKASKGYAYENKSFTEKPIGSIIVHPAGSIVATAEDMSKFLIAHLQNGKYEENTILKEDTAIEMHTRQFSQHDLMPGYGYGFYENYKNHKIMLHDGDTDSFTSQLSILPEENLGFFISYNTLDDGKLRDEFEEELYKFFGIELEEKTIVTEAFDGNTRQLEIFEGDYVFVNRLLEGPLKARGLFLKVKVRVGENGKLNLKVFDPSLGGSYKQIDENLFVNEKNHRRLLLKEGEDGSKYLFINTKVPMQSFEKLTDQEVFMESYLRPFVFIVALLGCLVSFFRLFRRRRKKKKKKKKKQSENSVVKRARKISSRICFLILFLGIGMILVIFTQSDGLRQGVLIGVNLMSIITAIQILLSIFLFVSVWKQKFLSIWSKGFYTLVTMAGIGALVYVYFLDLFFFI